MGPSEAFRLSDPSVVGRYLQLRSHFHDGILAQAETVITGEYDVRPTHRVVPTLTALTRTGFIRPGEGELWPVVFLTPVDITLALCVQFTPERLASLGTVLQGPQRLRHRHWEDWLGWETTLASVHPQFFEMASEKQDEASLNWYRGWLEWLVRNGLLARK